MARANAAYYAARNPFADFITAPEICQGFGEVLGLWAAIVWQNMGRPAPVVLAEAGPGRGTLMQDALRAIAAAAPDFRAALAVHLVETSPRLRDAQRTRIPDAVWHGDIASLPAGPMILLANEFLDALPIRQFVRTKAGWNEHFVQDGAFVEQPAQIDIPLAAQPGEIVEICEPARAIVAHLAARPQTVCLFVDYGPEHSAPGDSLQALRDGRPAAPLAAPGTADLTAHVDFAALAHAAQMGGAAVYGPVPQGVFLAQIGLPARIDRLARRAPPAQAMRLIAGARRLMEPHAMGRLFKTFAICNGALPPPPGFDPA